MWCLPPQQDAAFMCAMEDTLEVYARPYDVRLPQVCLDEAAEKMATMTSAPVTGVTEAAEEAVATTRKTAKKATEEKKTEEVYE
jgi:ribosomal protein L12E/L44/L45/RPP1/RPP2